MTESVQDQLEELRQKIQKLEDQRWELQEKQQQESIKKLLESKILAAVVWTVDSYTDSNVYLLAPEYDNPIFDIDLGLDCFYGGSMDIGEVRFSINYDDHDAWLSGPHEDVIKFIRDHGIKVDLGKLPYEIAILKKALEKAEVMVSLFKES